MIVWVEENVILGDYSGVKGFRWDGYVSVIYKYNPFKNNHITRE